jgi:hypothetical protein
MNHDKINKALEVLQNEGLKCFDEDADVNKYQAIGAAIAAVDDSIFAPGQLVHEYWEAHNRHDLATLLRWAFDYYLTGGGPVSMQEVQWVKHLIDFENIPVYAADGTSKRYSVTVVIQEI